MRTIFGFSPLFRSSIGYDRMLNALKAASAPGVSTTGLLMLSPGLARTTYRITIAVAGVSQDKLTITQEQNMLMVSGQKPGEDNSLYLHRGVAGRRFELAAQVKVARARLVGEKPPRAERSGSHQAETAAPQMQLNQPANGLMPN
jgi:molecular chaperone IbpA